MFRAATDAGDAILATAARRGAAYFCPECGEGLVLKTGAIVTAHFAHRPGSACHYGEGEGVRHLQMKAQIGALFGVAPEQYEVRLIRDHRADVVLYQQRIVVECQASAISVPEWEARTRAYNRCDYGVLWLWDFARVWKSEETLAAWRAENVWRQRALSGDVLESRIPVEIRNNHNLNFGRVYVLDVNGEPAACHLGVPFERESDGGPDGQWMAYTPKTLRIPDFMNVPGQVTRLRTRNGLVLAGLGERVWWK